MGWAYGIDLQNRVVTAIEGGLSHHKGNRGNPLTERQKKANKTRSKRTGSRRACVRLSGAFDGR
jgi:hypothetical protein